MGELCGFLGWVTVVSFGAAILNYFLKFLNKKYINKLPKDKANFVNFYRKVMRFFIKYHRMFGIIALISLIAHFMIAYKFVDIKVTGTVAGVIMLCICVFGFYGRYINKNLKGKWLKVHRILAFALIVFIIIHIL